LSQSHYLDVEVVVLEIAAFSRQACCPNAGDFSLEMTALFQGQGPIFEVVAAFSR
jgi:hypothetical protein